MGTNLDVRIVVNSEYLVPQQLPFDWRWRALAATDVPLSLAADTVTLPITVPLQVVKVVGCSRDRPDEKQIIHKQGEEVRIDSEE